MKLSPWMLSVVTFVVVVALCSTHAAKLLFSSTTSNFEGSQEEALKAGADLPSSSPQVLQRIPVLLTDILPGTKIEPTFLGEAPILRSQVEKHRDTVMSADAVVGRIARQKIAAAVPLRLSMLYGVNRKPDIRIPHHLRLVSVSFSGQQGLIGQFLQTGSYVDVLLTTAATEPKKMSARKLFDGVRVFSVVETTQSDEQFEVILELTSEQQMALLVAQKVGTLCLTYNPAGPGVEGMTLANVSKLLPPAQNTITSGQKHYADTSDAPDALRKPDPARDFSAEHFRAGEKTVTTFVFSSAD